ncbi:hypothetical protein [Actinoplanes sp. NBRC 103695]|uniref:hypothetical protein n=1 Tax=Actinoplanes sp. NBRC 103695 TaxID=3032202 RepID=UPI0024A3BBD9|nr:hypothetical protein [Actinoplanes sp. NBRC 103695]GLZ02277.1 hypothetical protein Acsp02_95280 [Actinoplanes sp. NBRC 103695]
MTSSSTVPPLATLTNLTTESRLIPSPWARMVRGIGLGQHSAGYEPAAAAHIRGAFAQLTAKVDGEDPYTGFCALLSELILRATESGDVEEVLPSVLQSVGRQDNPYLRLMAGSILMDAFAKLGLATSLLVNDHRDFPAEMLASLELVRPDRIDDENRGHHGDYERVCASAALFLSIGQLGFTDRLVAGPRNYIRESLALLENIPSPFYRGRGGALLFTVIGILGHAPLAHAGDRDYITETLDQLDRFDELEKPLFPQPMTVASAKVYPLLTMLNAIAACGTAEHLTRSRDRIAEADSLMAQLTTPELCHMSLYYITARANLGRPVENLDVFLTERVRRCEQDVDPGADFFLNGISFPYIFETTTILGRDDLISDEMIDRFLRCFPDLGRNRADRIHRTFPLSYGINALAGMGRATLMFEPSQHYAGSSPLAWVVGQFSEGAQDEAGRLALVNHALVDYALRQRGPGRDESSLFKGFHFPLAG